MQVSFTVLGHPQPQGSARAFVPKGWTRAVVTSDNSKLKPWRQDVSAHAMEARAKAGYEEPTLQAVSVVVTFFFDRPKSASKKVVHKTTKPDVDKLARGILDSLTGIVFKDDSQVIEISCRKHFGCPERAEIWVGEV